MKLNPAKFTFGVPAGKLLGYIVSERGIEANPEKIKAIMTLHKTASIKGIQADHRLRSRPDLIH